MTGVRHPRGWARENQRRERKSKASARGPGIPARSEPGPERPGAQRQERKKRWAPSSHHAEALRLLGARFPSDGCSCFRAVPGGHARVRCRLPGGTPGRRTRHLSRLADRSQLPDRLRCDPSSGWSFGLPLRVPGRSRAFASSVSRTLRMRVPSVKEIIRRSRRAAGGSAGCTASQRARPEEQTP